MHWNLGGRLHMKVSSYQYRDPLVKDKTVSRPYYLNHGNPHTWDDYANVHYLQYSKSIESWSKPHWLFPQLLMRNASYMELGDPEVNLYCRHHSHSWNFLIKSKENERCFSRITSCVILTQLCRWRHYMVFPFRYVHSKMIFYKALIYHQSGSKMWMSLVRFNSNYLRGHGCISHWQLINKIQTITERW